MLNEYTEFADPGETVRYATIVAVVNAGGAEASSLGCFGLREVDHA